MIAVRDELRCERCGRRLRVADEPHRCRTLLEQLEDLRSLAAGRRRRIVSPGDCFAMRGTPQRAADRERRDLA